MLRTSQNRPIRIPISRVLQYAAFFVALLSLVSVTACAPANHPNFSGSWTLDAARSDFGPVPGPAHLVQVIEHNEPVLLLKSDSEGFMGESHSEIKLISDGSEKTQTVEGKPRESQTYWDGNVLVTEWKIPSPGQQPLGMVDRRSLSEDGNTMTVDRKVHSQYSDWTQKAVFVRQPAQQPSPA